MLLTRISTGPRSLLDCACTFGSMAQRSARFHGRETARPSAPRPPPCTGARPASFTSAKRDWRSLARQTGPRWRLPSPPAAPKTRATRSLFPNPWVKSPLHRLTASLEHLLPPSGLQDVYKFAFENWLKASGGFVRPRLSMASTMARVSAMTIESSLERRPTVKSAVSRGRRASSRTREISDRRRLKPGPGSGRQMKFRTRSPAFKDA